MNRNRNRKRPQATVSFYGFAHNDEGYPCYPVEGVGRMVDELVAETRRVTGRSLKKGRPSKGLAAVKAEFNNLAAEVYSKKHTRDG